MTRTRGLRGTLLVSVIAVVVVAIDQLTKWWAEQALSGRPPVEVYGDILRLTFIRNPGGAFSIGTGQTWLFTIVAVAVAGVIVWYSRRITSLRWAVALGVLLGGAVGNLVDRIIQPPGAGQGHVVDFIWLPYWPVFNVADMAVVCGAIAVVVLSLMGVEPTAREPDPDQPHRQPEPAP